MGWLTIELKNGRDVIADPCTYQNEARIEVSGFSRKGSACDPFVQLSVRPIVPGSGDWVRVFIQPEDAKRVGLALLREHFLLQNEETNDAAPTEED